MQNDFVIPGEALVIPAAAATVPRIQQPLHSTRTSGTRIVYVQDTGFQFALLLLLALLSLFLVF